MSTLTGFQRSIAFLILLLSARSSAQQSLPLRDFVVLGKESVQLGSSSNIIDGGRIGSYMLVKTTGSATINSSIHSDGILQLANSNNVVGEITVANKGNQPNPIMLAGSNAALTGAISSAGDINISGGSVSGPVKTSGTYTGPAPASGSPQQNLSLADLNLPVLPPVITRYDLPELGTPSTAVNNTMTITPGAYKDMTLSGNKTVTFKGTGSYVFNSISNSGNFNKFVFDFEGNSNSVFRIFVVGDVNLYKINIDFKNLPITGGATQSDLAARIMMQVHGDGSTQGGNAWNITNGASGNNQSTWLGTVVALNGNINIGSGSSLSKIFGCLLSEKSVFIQSGVSITYVPLLCKTLVADAGPDKTYSCPDETGVTIGNASNNAAILQWTTLVDGVPTVVGHGPTFFATAAGVYTLTATNDCGDTVADAVTVTYNSCVDPINDNPDGKVDNLIGAELTYLAIERNTEEAKNYLVILDNDEYVLVEAVANVDKLVEARQFLLNAGLKDTIPNGINPQLITGSFPIAQLLDLTTVEAAEVINHVRPVFLPVSNAGLTTSSGDSSISTNLVRGGFDVGGEGIKIGVISDSYNTKGAAAIDVNNDDLPGTGNPAGNTTPVEVIQDYPWGERSDEGRAMLQIVHDLAPKSPLAFRTGFISAGDFAYGILQLKDAGCKVIVDDVTYVTEPFFRDGVVAQAVGIANQNNVAYFTSAGNFGSKSYTSLFNPISLPGGVVAHNFGGGDTRQHLKLKSGTYAIVLQWQDDIYSLGSGLGTENDLDVYMYDAGGRIGFNRNNIGGDPFEVLSFSINLPDPNQEIDADIMIVKAGSVTGAANPIFKYVIFRGNAVIDEYYSEQPLPNKSTIVGHANAANAITVGAVLWSNTPSFGVDAPTIASFSSTGGTPIFNGSNFITRLKPELTAPNGVNTTVNMGPDNDGSGNADGFSNFYGTSAAAPHAAAAAALVLNARKKFYNQDMPPDELKFYLFDRALEMQPDGVVDGNNFKAGYGLVQPDLSIRSFANPTPYISKLVYDATITPGTTPFRLEIAGQYLTSISKIYFRGEEVPTEVNVSLDTLSADIPLFTGNPPLFVVTPSFEGATGDGGQSNTLYFFSAKKDTISIVADNKVKKFGEAVPALTTTILVNGVPLNEYNTANNTTLTRNDLGVDQLNLRFSDPSINALTDVGQYQIRVSREFDLNNETDIGLLEKYVYDSTFGFLQINKLAVTVQPRDTTVVYGDALNNFHYNYIFDPAAQLEDAEAVTALLSAAHDAHIDNNVLGVVNSSYGSGLVIYNGAILPVFNNASIIYKGKLYPVVNGSGGSAVVILNDGGGTKEWPVTNGPGGAAVVILNSETLPVVNGSGGSAVVILNGQVYTVQVNAEGQQYVQYGNSTLFVNGSGGSAVVILNGEEIPVVNGLGGSAVVILNGEYYAVVNGSGGSAVVILNGEEVPVVNGSGGSAVVILNGEEIPVTNGSGGSAVVILNGEIVPVTNGQGGSAVVILNGENGDEEIPVINGQGGSAVVILNGQVYPVVNGSGGSAVVILNTETGTQEVPVTNGPGGAAVVILNSETLPVVNSLSPEALTNMSFMATTNAIANARIANSVKSFVDVSVNSLNAFNQNGNSTTLLNTLPLVNARGVLNASAIVNGSGGSAVVILNGEAISILNGDETFLNSETVPQELISRTPVVIDEADVNSAGTTSVTVEMEGMNMITSINAGSQLLIPAALFDKNFDISYQPGVVDITPAPLTVQAGDATKTYGTTHYLNPADFNLGSSDLKYFDQMLLLQQQSDGTKPEAAAGSYPIVPLGIIGAYGTDANNYTLQFTNGNLDVIAAAITVTADAKTKTYGSADPALTYTITGGALVNGDQLRGTLSRTAGEEPGDYSILKGTLTGGSNYLLNYVSANLHIGKAPLLVKADDKQKTFGSSNPPFTATYSGFANGDTYTNSVTGTPQFSTTADASSWPGTYTITVSQGTLTSSRYDFNFAPGQLLVTDNMDCLITHSKFSSFGSTTKTLTSLWVNIEVKVSGQLTAPGDYLMYSGGLINFYNINSSPAVVNAPIKRGIIIADATVTEPTSRFDAASDMFITRVPLGFSSTSDIFVAGGVLTSTNGFTKKNTPSSVLQGIFYSNRDYSDQWNYAIAAYQKPGGYVSVNDLSAEGSVIASNGTYKAGTPIPWLTYIASGGSGNGGNNYTGSSSSNDNFTNCTPVSRTLVMRTTDSRTETRLPKLFNVYPNPADAYAQIAFVPDESGTVTITLHGINGALLQQVYRGTAEYGKLYNTRVQTDRYAPGVYLLHWQQNGHSMMQKFVIMKR